MLGGAAGGSRLQALGTGQLHLEAFALSRVGVPKFMTGIHVTTETNRSPP